MVISEKFSLQSGVFGTFFHKNPLYGSHWNSFGHEVVKICTKKK